ncbi:hypothetical protein D3C78_1444530 [compost metagenome]
MRNFTELLWICLKAKAMPAMPANAINHHFWRNSERLITIWVKAGSSAPKPANTLSNCGTTLINRIAETISATTSTAIG